jgi:hypothetical protein
MTLVHVLIIIGVSFRAIKPGSSGRARSAFSNPNQSVILCIICQSQLHIMKSFELTNGYQCFYRVTPLTDATHYAFFDDEKADVATKESTLLILEHCLWGRLVGSKPQTCKPLVRKIESIALEMDYGNRCFGDRYLDRGPWEKQGEFG